MNRVPDPESPRAYVIIPKITWEDDSRFTCSPAVAKRSKSSLSEHYLQLSPQYEKIKTDCTTTLQELGLRHYGNFQIYVNLLNRLNTGINSNNLEFLQNLQGQHEEIRDKGLEILKKVLSWKEEIKDKGLEILQDFLGQKEEIKDKGLEILKNFLEQIDLNDPQSIGQLKEKIRAELIPQKQGLFKELEALGMTIALFPNDKIEKKAKESLETDYTFIPNFPLALPNRISLDSQTIQQAWPPEDSGISLAHEQGFRGQGVLIGVLDSGIDADHEEFAGRNIPHRYVSFTPDNPNSPSRDVRGFDTAGHGTHVCGILAGKTIGIAPEAKLYVANVIESETVNTSFLRVINGLDWLFDRFTEGENVGKPAVLNISVGFLESDFPTPEIFDDTIKDLREKIIELITEANVLMVAAIGNVERGRFTYPGAFKEVLGVGVIDGERKLAELSGSGKPNGEGVSKPDFVGYGVNISSCVGRDYENCSMYEIKTGTSMSSPYVAGIAALYRCQNPTWKADQIRDKMLENVLPLENEPSEEIGKGLIRFK